MVSLLPSHLSRSSTHRTLTTEVAKSLLIGLGDQQRLTQVLLNLVGNTINYTDGEGRVTATAESCHGSSSRQRSHTSYIPYASSAAEHICFRGLNGKLFQSSHLHIAVCPTPG